MPRSKELSEQMRTQSREQIVATARRLFAERGYYSTKVSDIAREAGMSAGNVYWYFAGKQEVLRAVLANGFETHEALLREAAAHPGTAQERLRYLVAQYLVFCEEHSAFLSVLISILGHSGAAFFDELGFDMREVGMSFHRHLTAILAQGQADGTVAHLEPDLLAMFFFSLFNGMMLTYGEDWRMIPPQAIEAAVLRLLGSPQAAPSTT